MRLTLAAWLCVAGVLAAMPAASADLPDGWRLEGESLVWTSEAPLRMGGARYEFRAGDRLLGYPMQEGDRLRLRVAPSEPLVDLSVWAAGRRLDAVATTRIAAAAG